MTEPSESEIAKTRFAESIARVLKDKKLFSPLGSDKGGNSLFRARAELVGAGLHPDECLIRVGDFNPEFWICSRAGHPTTASDCAKGDRIRHRSAAP